VLLLLALPVAVPAGAVDRINIRGLVELQAVSSDADRGWLEGGYGKASFDDNSAAFHPGKIAAHIDLRLQDTLWLRTLTAINANPYAELAFLEAYLHYRPVPRGAMRWRLKLGAFHPPLSLENTQPGWSSDLGSTPSLINAWIGEELRTIGTELAVDWIGRYRQSPNDYSLVFGLYGFNDPAGAILSRRGWAQHDRQTSLTGYIPSPYASTGPKAVLYPFREIDNEPGYYVGGTWKYLNRWELQAFHYDNRADASAMRDGKSAWNTRFQQLALQGELPAGVRVLGQFMIGDTKLDNRSTGVQIDADFSSAFVLVSKSFDKHALSVRYEVFDTENRSNVGNFLVEDGHSWTLSYVFKPAKDWWANVEWLAISTDGHGRNNSPAPFHDTDHQFLFSLRRYFP